MEVFYCILLILVLVAKSFIGLWIWSVWSWRLRSDTGFRGGGAKNLLEEFKTYGYPMWVFKMVGAVKCSCASMLVASMIFPSKIMTLVGAGGMVFLMTVALVSHCKVKDELRKSVPALSMFTLATYILAYTLTLGGNVYDIHLMFHWMFTSEHDPEFSEQDNASSTALGMVVTITCFYMWFRSFCNGDYNLASYAQAREEGTYALLA